MSSRLSADEPLDLVLSGGFLAFGRHTGFLAAVEELELPIRAVCGTSSGALIGSLWAAGHRAKPILDELTALGPLRYLQPSFQPWRGLLWLDPVIDKLRSMLPERFDDLPMPFAVGVVDPDGEHGLLTAGPLPESVAASCAIPRLFVPVPIDGRAYSDGGLLDRTALSAWRALHGERPTLLHLVERSHGADCHDDLDTIPHVQSPRSGAALWSLGDVQGRFEQTKAASLERLRALLGQDPPVGG